MTPIEITGAGLVLLASVSIGVLAHESAHAITLRLSGIPYTAELLPDRNDAGQFGWSPFGSFAAVTPEETPGKRVTTRLRIAALMPLALASPFALVPMGIVPDPFLADDPYMKVAIIGWCACALPSPQDFSVFWYAERALAGETSPNPD